jgi:iron(III) transport system ATP-binding protein
MGIISLMFALELSDVVKQYAPDQRPAVNHVSLAVRKGEILSIVGPSGCGKTSTLRLIAGFERPDGGAIALNGQIVANHTAWVPAERRGVGMVFQDHALFPHLRVRENVSFGLRHKPRPRAQSETEHLLRLVGLDHLADRYPHELSGGERQRAALARALAPEPVLVLLDEPFSNLDADRRATMREQVRAILRTLHATAVFVTHDQEEALFMGDCIAVMNQGCVEQIDIPEKIFHAPATRFVADFMGHTDFLPGEVTADGIMTEIGRLPQRVALPVGTTVEVAVRADDVTFEHDPASKAFVLARHFKGAQNVYRVRLPSGRLIHSLQPHTLILPAGTPVRIWPDAGHPLACFHEGRLAPTSD